MKTEGYMHSLNTSKPTTTVPMPVVFIVFAVVALLGGITAYLTSSKTTASLGNNGAPKGTAVQTDKAAGVLDKKTFKDSSTGVLREGGMEGEGNFHLERPGGISQNVYLTSSTVDLSKYIGKKVTVWGQTFQGQKAGWLMDVGLVEMK
jgi:hypothetical protein